MLICFDVNLINVAIMFIFEEVKRLIRITLAAGQEPLFSERIVRKTFIFPTYSTVPASGIARRDPPRHVDVVMQILIKIWPM